MIFFKIPFHEYENDTKSAVTGVQYDETKLDFALNLLCLLLNQAAAAAATWSWCPFILGTCPGVIRKAFYCNVVILVVLTLWEHALYLLMMGENKMSLWRRVVSECSGQHSFSNTWFVPGNMPQHFQRLLCFVVVWGYTTAVVREYCYRQYPFVKPTIQTLTACFCLS